VTIFIVSKAFRILIGYYTARIMKFTLAVIGAVAAAASTAEGFSPVIISHSKNTQAAALYMSTETPTQTYTFTKSEEIFAEAQTVCISNSMDDQM
jgi:hypothetical protein